MTRVEPILGLYDMHDPCLRVGEQFNIAVRELNTKVRTGDVLVGTGLAMS